MPAGVFERIESLLQQARASFTVHHHAPVFTSEEAAAVRGVSLSSGAKALVVKAGEGFVLLVMPADRKLNSRTARAALGAKAIRFATREEVERLTGLLPGSIPPFGSLFGLATHCDPALIDETLINFNAGDHAVSVQMSCADYLAVEKPALHTLT